MNRKEQILIYGEPFLIDNPGRQLVRIANKGDFFRFEQFDRDGAFMVAAFDRGRRTLIEDTPFVNERLKIPAELFDKKFDIEEKDAVQYNRHSYKNGFGFVLLEQALVDRLRGLKPKMTIDGVPYEISWDKRKLIPSIASGRPEIKFLHLSAMNNGGYEGILHLPSGRVSAVDTRLTELPKESVLLRLPDEFVLDPVGTALDYGLSATSLLHRFPMQMEQRAELISLSETNLGEMVRRNQVERETQPLETHQREHGRRTLGVSH